jgi:hypothetical protein
VCVCVCVLVRVCRFRCVVFLLIKIRSSEHGFSLFIISFATLIARTRCRIVQALPTVPPHATNKSNTRKDIHPCTHEQHDNVSVQVLSGGPQPQERYAQGHKPLPRTHTHTQTHEPYVTVSVQILPPVRPRASNTTTSTLFSRKRRAVARPETPAPITMTRGRI